MEPMPSSPREFTVISMDSETMNDHWKTVLMILGIITVVGVWMWLWWW